MPDNNPPGKPAAKEETDFAAQADQRPIGFVREFLDFLRHNKKWWLLPIVGLLVLLGVLIAVGGSVVAPFIYTLF